MIEIKSGSFEETMKTGAILASILRAGDVVGLRGGLGAGKTAFTRGMAKTLGIKEHITSPTFTIVNEYKGKMPLYHFDVYRITDPEEMFEIGFDEYIHGSGIVVIEWAELIKKVLPKDLIWVNIEKDFTSGQDTRKIFIYFTGERYAEYEERLAQIVNKK